MKRILLGLLISATLCGCSIIADDNSSVATNNSQGENSEISTPFASSVAFQQQFGNRFSAARKNTLEGLQTQQAPAVQSLPEPKHDINYYARGLMQDLVANLEYVNTTTPLAVVSFVMLDSDYDAANLIGIQIAESLMHEAHKFGIPVIDFKSTGFIRVTKQGDFAFSKDYADLSGDMPARYIMGGTMLKNIDGYLINARIVGVKSRAVVATAQSFIPNSVSDSILEMVAASTENDGQPEKPADNMTTILPSSKFFLIQE